MTSQQLKEERRHILDHEIQMDEAGPWLMAQLGTKSDAFTSKTKKFLSIFIMLIVGGIIGYYGATTMMASKFSINSLWVLIALIPILVIHEFIHGVMYKYYGAPKVGYGWSKKSMMVYAYADDFVITMQQLKMIAIMPFVVITPTLLLALILFSKIAIAIVLILVIHTLGCVGDFALVKYARLNSSHVTYDLIKETGKMYFWKER